MDPDRIDLRAAGSGVLNGLETMRNPAGGFVETIAFPYQANAHMHPLEARLAWTETAAASGTPWPTEIVEMALRGRSSIRRAASCASSSTRTGPW